MYVRAHFYMNGIIFLIICLISQILNSFFFITAYSSFVAAILLIGGGLVKGHWFQRWFLGLGRIQGDHPRQNHMGSALQTQNTWSHPRPKCNTIVSVGMEPSHSLWGSHPVIYSFSKLPRILLQTGVWEPPCDASPGPPTFSLSESKWGPACCIPTTQLVFLRFIPPSSWPFL